MMLAACAALLFGLTSCNLDLIDDYSFSLAYESSIEDETLSKEVKEYMDAFIEQPGLKAEYPHTTYAEAMSQAMEMYHRTMDQIDPDFVLSHIQSENDIIHLVGFLIGKKIKEPAGQSYWTWNWKQEQTEAAQ